MKITRELLTHLTVRLQLEERIEVSLEQDYCPAPGADIKSTTSAADLTTTIYHVSLTLISLVHSSLFNVWILEKHFYKSFFRKDLSALSR